MPLEEGQKLMHDMRLIQPSVRDGRKTKPLFPAPKRRAWSLDVRMTGSRQNGHRVAVL